MRKLANQRRLFDDSMRVKDNVGFSAPSRTSWLFSAAISAAISLTIFSTPVPVSGLDSSLAHRQTLTAKVTYNVFFLLHSHLKMDLNIF